MMDANTITSVLDGIRVIDFTQMMLGPWGTQFLGDFGADVIKVERPGRGEWERSLAAMGELLGGDSPFFMAMNRNKRSLTLNLKHPRAIELVKELVKDADLVVENYRPGVMDRLGIGYEALREVNPGIVYVAGSGYGPDGPYVKRPGQDLLIQAMSGLAANSGPGDGLPVAAATSYVDASTALMLALSATLGLFHRLRTGQGQRIDVSLFNTAVALQCQELTAFMNLDKRWQRSEAGISSPWLGAPFGLYETKNGYMAISMNPLDVVGEIIGDSGLAEFNTDEAAFEHRDDIKRRVQAKVREQTTEHWLEQMLARDLWCAPVQDFETLVSDPQVQHNGLIQTVTHPSAGEVKVVGTPMKFSETPGRIERGVPSVGQHTDEVLHELGYDQAQCDSWRAEGVI
jgi:crotonobetainyl-CoA:carnitine CoA-transferase CaiB-like acyl-CoA transferase